MKKAYTLLFLSLMILNFPVLSQEITAELKNNFSDKQIADILKLVEFFKSQVCENQSDSFSECMESQSDYIYRNAMENNIYEKIDFKKQKQVYKSLRKKTFKEIWRFGKTRIPELNKSYKSLGSKYNGKYQSFLKDVANSDERFRQYANSVIGSGTFNYFSFYDLWIKKFDKNIDLNNLNNQVIIAIHYLSKNDELKRIPKYYAQQLHRLQHTPKKM